MATLAAARLLVEDVERDQPQAVALAKLASFAVRVDPPLLRRLRLELLPGSSPALEAEVWHGGLVTFRGPEGFVFAPGVGAVLREGLAADASRYERAWILTREVHAHWLSPALRLEEELNYHQFSQKPGAYDEARELLRSAVAKLVQEKSPGLVYWAAGAATRLPSGLMDMEEGRMLAAASRARLQGGLLLPSPPSGAVPEWMPWIAPEGLERIRLGVKMSPRTLTLDPRNDSHEDFIELPRTNPLVVEVVEVDEQYGRRFDFSPPGTARIDHTGHALRLRTLVGDEYIIEPAKPDARRVPPPEAGPIAHPHVLRALLDEVGRSTLIAIAGLAGVGKTQLIRHAIAQSEHVFQSGSYYLDAQGSGVPPSAQSIAWNLVRAIAPEQAKSREDALQLYRYLTSERRMALVLEDVDSLSWSSDAQAVAELNALRPAPGSGALLLLTSRKRIEGLDARWIELGEIDPVLAVDMLKRLVPRASEQASAIAEACRYLAIPMYEVSKAIAQLPSDSSIERYVLLLRQARRLAVFPESFDLRAAETVLVGEETGSISERSMAQEMIQAGLLRWAGPGRYALWAPVRLVVEAEWGEPEPYEAAWHHAGYYLRLLEGLHGQYMLGGAARAEAIAAFDADSVNIVVAIEWLLVRVLGLGEEGGIQRVLSSLTAVPPSLLRLRRTPRERERWFNYASRLQENPFVLLEWAIAEAELGQESQAVETCERAWERIAFPSEDAASEGIVVKLARFQLEAGYLEDGRSTLQEVLTRGLSSSAHGAERHYVTAFLHSRDGRVDEAEEEMQIARSLAAIEGDICLEVDALRGLAEFAAARKELGRAAALYEDALEFARAWRDDRGAALASWGLGLVRARQGIRERAGELLQGLVDYYRLIGHARVEQVTRQREDLLLHPRKTEDSPSRERTPVVNDDVLHILTPRIATYVRHRLKCDEEIAHDAAVDAVVSYLNKPDRYDSSKSNLEQYLSQVAFNLGMDRIRSAAAQAQREQQFASELELHLSGAPTEIERMHVSLDANAVLEKLVARGYLKNERDMAALKLLLHGERSTEQLAKALGLDALNQQQKQLEVKRQRDRLMKILERFGKQS